MQDSFYVGKSDAFLIHYLQFLNIKNRRSKKKLSFGRGHTSPTNLSLSCMEYLNLRNQIVDHTADLFCLVAGCGTYMWTKVWTFWSCEGVRNHNADQNMGGGGAPPGYGPDFVLESRFTLDMLESHIRPHLTKWLARSE
jgi:hypothetical protein